MILALLTSMLSPVAGLFLAAAAAALVVCGQRRQGLYIGLAAAVTLAIPDTGRQPVGIKDLAPPAHRDRAVLAGVPRQWRVIRAGAAIHAVGTLAAWLLPTAVGANADRLGELLAGPAGRLRRCSSAWPSPAGMQTAALVSAKIDALYGQSPELPADHESTGMARRRLSPCGSATSRSPRRRSTCTPDMSQN